MPTPESIRAVFFDIDDTLYRKFNRFIPESVTPALKALHDNGIFIAIASGRTPAIIPPGIHRLMQDTGMEIFIAGNGQLVLQNGEIIIGHPLPREDVVQWVEFARTHGWDYLMHTADALVASARNARVDHAMEAVEPWEVDADRYLKTPVYQFAFFVNEDELQAVLAANLSLQDTYRPVPWHEFGIDMIPTAGSKARGIIEVCERFHIPLEQTLAFGDNLNDLEMFRTVGTSVAMGDACDELKAIASFVTDPLEDHGIANALKKLKLIGGQDHD